MSPTIKGSQIRDETIETNDIKDNTIEGQDVNTTGSFTMGALGLGTTPTTRLHVGSSTSTVAEVILIQNDQAKSEIGMARDGSDILSVAAPGDLIINNVDGNDILFGTTNTQRMIIDKDGNVGIGTMDPPIFLLEVNGTTDFGGTTTFKNGEAGLIGWNVGSHKWILRGESGFDMSMGGDGNSDQLYISGSTGYVGVGTTSPSCTLHVAGALAASGPSKTFQTFTNGDYTPSLANGNLFKTYDGAGQGATSFDDGVAGQIVTIISTDAFTYMVSAGNLKGGSTDITTAATDVTTWIFDGTYWYLMNFMDQSADLSGGH